MYKDDYGDTETTRKKGSNTKSYTYGWDIDHIKPSSKQGEDHLNNYEPMHWINNQQEKADNINFKVNDISYQVIRCNICERNSVYGYGIKNQSANSRVDWKGKKNRYYPN